VKQFNKIFLVCAFFAAIFVANVYAQSPSQTAADSSAAISNPENATTVQKAEEVPAAAPAVFHVLGLPITNSMI